jgi:UDP-N-acetyl-D-mannosaminuronic acid transferase (WecB/TagA/CpsF family)
MTAEELAAMREILAARRERQAEKAITESFWHRTKKAVKRYLPVFLVGAAGGVAAGAAAHYFSQDNDGAPMSVPVHIVDNGVSNTPT